MHESAAVNEPVPELPRQLGRYERLGEIARGGMASVHLGRVRAAGGFERIVAIKCCHPHLSSDPEFIAMFLDEARIAASIHHANVVATLDVGSVGSVLYHVMEYVEGERLVDVARSGPIPIAIAVRILIDALRGLHAAHEIADPSGTPLDVVHRDVSPQNIMVGVDGITRLMDFGIARASARSTVTEQGVVKGKFAYMAPEQLMGQLVDRRCDIFAAGVVLWETLTGERLFQGASQGETVNRVLHIPVEPPSRRRREAAPLDAVVGRALARAVDQRFPTALAFAEALEAAATEVAKPASVAAFVRETGGSAAAERRRLLSPSPGVQNASPLGTPTSAAQTKPVVSATRETLEALDSPTQGSPEGRTAPGADLTTRSEHAGSTGFGSDVETTVDLNPGRRRRSGLVIGALIVLCVAAVAGLGVAFSTDEVLSGDGVTEAPAPSRASEAPAPSRASEAPAPRASEALLPAEPTLVAPGVPEALPAAAAHVESEPALAAPRAQGRRHVRRAPHAADPAPDTEYLPRAL